MMPLPAALVRRATQLGGRVLGLAGAPGAGKSTLAAALARAVPGSVVLPMDGFHLSTSRLIELGRVERRGAPDTFDAAGYVALLRRVAAGEDVRAPGFDRSIEEPVPGAIEVPAAASLVITEGNYLLLDDGPWAAVRGLLSEAWFVEIPESLRRERLVARFVSFGMDEALARERVEHGSDAANAALVAQTRRSATLVVDPQSWGHER